MQTKIHSMIKTKVGWERVTIFGYSTKSVPGLEVQGLGCLGRNMKEKFVFLAKERKISFPFKRYVLCIDLSEIKSNLEKDSIHYLELPFLMTFFYLGGLLPIRTLEDCFAIGSISVAGKVKEPELPIEKFEDFKGENLKFISLSESFASKGLKTISTIELFSGIPDLSF